MSLKVVGAGFGRTGTLSLKVALERIGFGPCYHMVEVFPRPEHVAMWHRLAFEQSMDWDEIFRGFGDDPEVVQGVECRVAEFLQNPNPE